MTAPNRREVDSLTAQTPTWKRLTTLIVNALPAFSDAAHHLADKLRADAVRLQDLREVPYDPWQATHLANHMQAEGLPMVEMRQTVATLSEPMKTLEALVLQGPARFQHDASPVMAWMVSNVVCHRDAKDNVYPRKEREENKIDGPVAVMMGLARTLAGGKPERSFWEAEAA